MTSKTIIAIPHWMCNVLSRNGMRVADVVDYDKMKSVFCPEDLASVLALRGKITNHKALDTLGYYDAIYSRWSKKLNAVSAATVPDENAGPSLDGLPNQRQEFFDVIVPLSHSAAVLNDLSERLEDKNRKPDDCLYRLIDCERDILVLVIFPGFFEALVREKFVYGIFKRLLKISYVYSGSPKSFEQPLFGRYIKLLDSLSTAQKVPEVAQ